ncbi:unnamed protein product [Hymenolepis diminuta]|uniref:Protein KRI1 homolog n=1 Tax=Hymenolepis diminuta TaxID=6216 RepID=A0A0R3SRS2_HYMDI|nr:unnamed protein product [Hymenolepis diminuta]
MEILFNPDHHDEDDYDEFLDDSIYDDDYFYDAELPKFHARSKVHEKDIMEGTNDETPFRKTKDIIEDPDKGIMTLEERQPVKRNKNRMKDPKYRKGLQELAGLM